jgi:hypothetical protein
MTREQLLAAEIFGFDTRGISERNPASSCTKVISTSPTKPSNTLKYKLGSFDE